MKNKDLTIKAKLNKYDPVDKGNIKIKVISKLLNL